MNNANSLPCPKCGHPASGVIDSRTGVGVGRYIRRRRQCAACGERFSTHERIVEAPLKVEPRELDVEGMSFSQIASELVLAKRDIPLALSAHGKRYIFIRTEQDAAAAALFFAQHILLSRFKQRTDIPIKK